MMGYEITQIRLGDRKVGLVGITAAFTEVQKLEQENPEQIKSEIIKRLRTANYIPATAEAEYGRALLNEYRRFLGEDVQQEPEVPEVRVYGGA